MYRDSRDTNRSACSCPPPLPAPRAVPDPGLCRPLVLLASLALLAVLAVAVRPDRHAPASDTSYRASGAGVAPSARPVARPRRRGNVRGPPRIFRRRGILTIDPGAGRTVKDQRTGGTCRQQVVEGWGEAARCAPLSRAGGACRYQAVEGRRERREKPWRDVSHSLDHEDDGNEHHGDTETRRTTDDPEWGRQRAGRGHCASYTARVFRAESFCYDGKKFRA